MKRLSEKEYLLEMVPFAENKLFFGKFAPGGKFSSTINHNSNTNSYVSEQNAYKSDGDPEVKIQNTNAAKS